MECCSSGSRGGHKKDCDPVCPPSPAPGSRQDRSVPESIAWFDDMISHAYDYASAQKAKGHPVVGILCEYSPRELIMAAGAVPVCMCGGSAKMIPPAEEALPSNLCPLIKSTFGYSLEKANPFMEMADLIIAETTCDGKKKMYELMQAQRRMHVLELPQKSGSEKSLSLWKSEIENLKSALERQFDTEITSSSISAAIEAMNAERGLRKQLAELMKQDEPPLTGKELLGMKSIISCIPEDMEMYRKALLELPKRNIRFGGRTRVLVTGVPMPHGAEKVIDIIEQMNGLVVCQENCTGLKPIYEPVCASSDPIEALAAKYFSIPCSVMTPNSGRMNLLRMLVHDYRPDCIVDTVWQACITYDVESYSVRKLCETEFNIPYMRIETDYFPSDNARISNRLQALFETASANKRHAPA